METGLRAFAAVAQHHNFGLAARQLSITQPALTKQIQALERDLGGRLFDRGRHGATLTELGAHLLPQAQQLLDDAEAFARRARALARGERGRLAVGFGLSSIELAPRLVAAFRARYPRVDVVLEDMSSTAQLHALRTGELHAGFVRLPTGRDLHHRPVDTDRLALATTQPPDADPKTWLAGALVRLARAKGPGLAAQIDTLCAAWHISPGTVHETHDLQTVLALVAAGAGPALVPHRAAAIAPPAVTLTPLHDPAASWTVALAWHPAQPTAPTANFLALATELTAQETPDQKAFVLEANFC